MVLKIDVWLMKNMSFNKNQLTMVMIEEMF
jgi:hypothetical protein